MRGPSIEDRLSKVYQEQLTVFDTACVPTFENKEASSSFGIICYDSFCIIPLPSTSPFIVWQWPSVSEIDTYHLHIAVILVPFIRILFVKSSLVSSSIPVDVKVLY